MKGTLDLVLLGLIIVIAGTALLTWSLSNAAANVSDSELVEILTKSIEEDKYLAGIEHLSTTERKELMLSLIANGSSLVFEEEVVLKRLQTEFSYNIPLDNPLTFRQEIAIGLCHMTTDEKINMRDELEYKLYINSLNRSSSRRTLVVPMPMHIIP